MNSINFTIYIIIAICLLPYLFTFIAKLSGGFAVKDNQNPRQFLARATGLSARANAVQQNSFESLPFFLTSVLLAEYLVVPDAVIWKLSVAYLILRVIYGFAYLADLPTFRSIIWFLSMLCPVLLMVFSAKL
jgi:uncharacterized MAPEG superfamily protein